MSKAKRGITTAIPRLPVDSGELDGFVRDLLTVIDQAAIRSRPTMGTVTAVQGGEITVHIDGERISRTVGFARKKGSEYAVGNRVKLSLLRNDEYVVDGIVGSDAGDSTVKRNQLGINAVGASQIELGQVTYEHLEQLVRNILNNALTSIPANSVGTSELKENAVGGAEIKADVVDWQHLRGDSSHFPGSLGYDLERLVNFAKGKGWI